MFKSEASPQFTASGVCITGWSHVWQVYLSPGSHTYSASSLPPPFEAYGPDVEFVLEKCMSKDCKSWSKDGSKDGSKDCSKECSKDSTKDRSKVNANNCKEYTLARAREEQEFIPKLFKNYATVFGATRNKRVALSTKKRKTTMQEDSADEESEEQDLDAKSEDDGDESQSSEESSESSEEEEEDMDEDEKDEKEEEEEEEEESSPKVSAKQRVTLI
jgi:hypothetical protein